MRTEMRTDVRRHCPSCRPGPALGFTLVELVTVLVLLGILSAVALPRFFDNTFSERGFHDAAKAAIQHARRVAVASRRFVCVTTAPGTGAAATVALTIDARAPENIAGNVDCAAPLALPAPARGCAATNQVCAPNGVTLGPLAAQNLIFDALGRSVTAPGVVAAARTITVSGQVAITIDPETGWVE